MTISVPRGTMQGTGNREQGTVRNISISTEARGVVEKSLRPLDCARGGVEVVLEVEKRTYNNKYIAYKSVRCTLNAKR